MPLGHSAEEIARVREPAPHDEHTRVGHNYRIGRDAVQLARPRVM